MKNILLSIILVTLNNYCFCQDTISDDQKKQFLINIQLKLKPSQIIKNFRPEDREWLQYDEYSSKVPFQSAYNLNIFDYFKLNEIYNSDFKKEVFKQTTEYKNLLDSLNKIKYSYLNSVYYDTGFNRVTGETFSMENFNNQQHYTVNYDIQKKGFYIGIGHVLPYQCNSAFCPKIIEGVEFKQLEVSKKYNLSSNSAKSYRQYLFLPMDASAALEIENNRSEIEVLRVFTIMGIYSKTFADADFIAENHGKPCKVQVVRGGSMRLLVYNKKTDKIYFDKIYK